MSDMTDDAELGKATITEIVDLYLRELHGPGPEPSDRLVLERFATRLQNEWKHNVMSKVDALVASRTPPAGPTYEVMKDALERIALLDEADGHALTADHALRAVGIASHTLGKHPSVIFQEREARKGRA